MRANYMTQVLEEDKTAHKIERPWAEEKYLKGVKIYFLATK